MGVFRIQTWDEYKRRVSELHPGTVFYLSEPHPLRTPPLGLRLTFYNSSDMYVFVDHADGSSLVKTGIPVVNHMDRVNVEVREQDIRSFLSKTFPWAELVSLPPFMY